MTFSARDLKLEMIEPGDLALVRLFSRPDAEWEPPPPMYRNERCDPPVGKKDDYALLYTANRLDTTAMECQILAVDRQGNWTYDEAKTKSYHVARYSFTQPAIFIPLDENRHHLEVNRTPFVPGYGPWQDAAHDLWRRFGTTVHGLSWWSMHRHQVGRVYAIWHERKAAMGLERPLAPFDKLYEDADWKSLLLANPGFAKLSPSTSSAAAAGPVHPPASSGP